MEKRYFKTELRFEQGDVKDGMVLAGLVMRYGDTADMGDFKEVFRAGAFGDLSDADVILNRQHDRNRPLARTGGGGLELFDSENELTFRAVLPNSESGKDLFELVRKKVMRGVSIEFIPEEEDFNSGTRIIKRARLLDIGLVDRPAYPESLADISERMKKLNSNKEEVYL